MRKKGQRNAMNDCLRHGTPCQTSSRRHNRVLSTAKNASLRMTSPLALGLTLGHNAMQFAAIGMHTVNPSSNPQFAIDPFVHSHLPAIYPLCTLSPYKREK
ncbi:hypothetical protein BgiMline_024301 [Biomphalaria glabrata]|nr:hypothetical protein BgiMline_007502 [Biomphalaria glabrata]KAI8784144.1 hypothetical protein BgiBS90_015760 [Biomphalaria glabrata]